MFYGKTREGENATGQTGMTQFTVKCVKHSDGVIVWAPFSGIGGRFDIYFLP